MCLVKRAATSVDDMAAAGVSCVRRITTWQYEDAQRGAVGVEWLQRTAYDVGMVLLDNGGTASRRVERCSFAVLRTLVKRGASLSFQNLPITFDNEVSEGRHGRV